MGSCLTPQEFRRISFSGYVLNREQDSFYYMSLSRQHPHRIHTSKRLSEGTTDPQQRSPTAPRDDTLLGSEAEAQADSEVGHTDESQ